MLIKLTLPVSEAADYWETIYLKQKVPRSKSSSSDFDRVSRKLSLFTQQQMGTDFLQSWGRCRQQRERR